MSQFEEYKKKYGHLDADEKEMRRKYYTYLQEQQMLLELVGGAARATLVNTYGWTITDGGQTP
jgi:hypothetical protein